MTDKLKTSATSASAIAESIDKGGKGKAAAASIDESAASLAATEAEEKEDNSLFARIAKSGLVFVNDHSTGNQYVGIPPSQDPDSSEASRRLAAISPLSAVGPRTGMKIVPKGGDPFQVGEGFGPDANPDRWEGVVNPETGKALFAA